MVEKSKPATIHDPVRVFLSHVMDVSVDDVRAEVAVVREVVDREPDYDLWTFEDVPASGLGPEASWTLGINRSDVFVLVVGNDVTEAVENEVELAVELRRWPLVFVKGDCPDRSARAIALVGRIKDGCTYKEFATPEELREALELTLRSDTRFLTRIGIQTIKGAGLIPLPWRSTTPMSVGEAAPVAATGPAALERPEIQLLVARARELLVRGRYTDALTEYESLQEHAGLERTPELHARVLNNLSLAARWLERSDLALRSSAAAMKIDPTNEGARLTHLGNLVAFRVDGWREAISDARPWLEARPDGLQLLSAISIDDGDFAAAVTLGERVLDRKPEEHAARMNKGHALAKLGRLEEGLTVLNEIPAASPLYIFAQVRRAEILYQQAKGSRSPRDGLRSAIEALDAAQRRVRSDELRDDDWTEARIHAVVCRSGIWILEGRAVDAIDQLEQIEPLIGHQREFRLNLAQAWVAAGNNDEAIGILESVLAECFDDSDSAVWLAALLMDRFNANRNEEDLKRAESILRHLLESTANPLAVLNLTQIYVAAGRLAEASSLVDAAHAKLPNDEEVAVARLTIAARRGDTALALGIAHEIHKRNRLEPFAGTVLGVDAFRKGRFADAILSLRDAIADPFCRSVVHVEAYRYLARALRRLDRHEEAIEAAMSAAQRYPNVPELRRLCEEMVNKDVT